MPYFKKSTGFTMTKGSKEINTPGNFKSYPDHYQATLEIGLYESMIKNIGSLKHIIPSELTAQPGKNI
jgi:hypothetical protein